jgi:hypothetical protein
VRQSTVFFLLIMLTACSNRTGIPNGIIPPDSMQGIMKDVIVAEQFSNTSFFKDSTKNDKVKANQDLLATIFKMHHISKESFRESLLFYESRPDLNKKIFDSLAVYANRRRVELYAPKPLTKPVKLPAK